jgi:hypothetical protein
MKKQIPGLRRFAIGLLFVLSLSLPPSLSSEPADKPDWIGVSRENATHWIWSEGLHARGQRNDASPGVRTFRRSFDIEDHSGIRSAVLQIASSDGFAARLNHNTVAEAGPSGDFTTIDITKELIPLRNEIEVMISHDGGKRHTSGLAAELTVTWDDGRSRTIRSGRDWSVSTTLEDRRPARELGQVNADQRQAKFVPNRTDALPLFRKTFHLSADQIDAARATIVGLGHFELSINGRKVGDHVLDPPWSNYAYSCHSVDFDVSKMLQPGENVVGVMLGNGMFNVLGGRYAKFIGSFGPPMLHFDMEIDQGGRKTSVVSDTTWKTSDGPIRFSCIYGGEDHDAREEQTGWNRPGFNDGEWAPVALVDGPGGVIVPATAPPIKVVRHLDPVSITRLPDGRYEVDLGENLSSRPTLVVRGKRGSSVTIETAEFRGKPWNGHSYTYTLKGGPEPERFVPLFTFFSFQYLYISGAAWGNDAKAEGELPELLEIGADFISSCGPRIGAFACSNPLFNEIDAMIDRSVASNLQHVITDCPHREKLGWLEVSHLMGPSILYNYDMGGLYRKIARDMSESQLLNGSVPTIAPEFVRFIDGYFESPEWGSAAVQIPWLLYQWYGDTAILKEQYKTMTAYTGYLAGTRLESGLVKGGLGDWYDWTPERGHVGPSQLTPKELTATCMLYKNARILQQVARMLNKPEDAHQWKAMADKVRHDFIAHYYDAEHKTVATGSQTSLALALHFDLVPDSDREAVLATLVKDLESKQYRQSSGEVAFGYLVMALAEGGRSDVVYRMIDRTDAPGYGHMLRKYGLKTLSEQWDKPGSSLNHCMFGHIQEWFRAYLLGIRQAPGGTGFDKVLIDPYIPDDLEWAQGSFDSPNGRIEVAWKKLGDKVEVRVQAEKADIVLPEGRKDIVWSVKPASDKAK